MIGLSTFQSSRSVAMPLVKHLTPSPERKGWRQKLRLFSGRLRGPDITASKAAANDAAFAASSVWLRAAASGAIVGAASAFGFLLLPVEAASRYWPIAGLAAGILAFVVFALLLRSGTILRRAFATALAASLFALTLPALSAAFSGYGVDVRFAWSETSPATVAGVVFLVLFALIAAAIEMLIQPRR